MAIDPKKLQVAVRRIETKVLYSMLDDAIELLPPSKLAKLAGRYLDVNDLQPPGPGQGGLLAQVKVFQKASLAGDYYESFAVNSKNYREISGGTRTWIAECLRLLDSCVSAAAKDESDEACEAFGILFALLQHLDDGLDDVIFFADEGGSWQVGIDWQTVLPAWYTCLSATAGSDEFADRVVEIVNRYMRHDRDNQLALAARQASPAQRQSLEERAQGNRRKARHARIIPGL